MIEDAEARSDDRFRDRRFDVCVVGSGPAGITLARRLSAHGLRVGLFEAGSFDLTTESQDAYRGTHVGEPAYYPLDACRLRFFGGTSNHWGAWTRPLDAYDFEPEPHHPLSGWPIAKTDLDPYARDAAAILNLPPDRDPPVLFAPDEPGLVARLIRFSRPTTRFGRKYRAELKRSRRIEVFLNANLIDLRLDPEKRSITDAIFRCYKRQDAFAVKARAFVLCLGGLENARALLNANNDIPTGLGNEHDLVGRYFLEHPHAPVGKVVLRQPLTWMLVYSPTPELMRSEGILNFGLRIGDRHQWFSPKFTGAFKPALPCHADFDTLLAAAIKGEPAPCPANVNDVLVECEQSLEASNRVRLIDDRDRFGLRRIELAWRLSEMDLHTLRTAASVMAQRLANRDLGRMQIVKWLAAGEMPTADQLWGGNHHMGTTRMSDDPKYGVVNADGRVHSLANLYCGGSSVFATAGHANPTYTIVQLALRLGDHLWQTLRGS